MSLRKDQVESGGEAELRTILPLPFVGEAISIDH